MRKTLSVVAAILENDQHEIMCALRSPRMSLPNQWEFPGGKIQEGETPEQAIEREIREELKCSIKANRIFLVSHHDYDTFSINLTAIRCTLKEGVPTAHEHSKLIWLKRENLNALKWAPADVATMEQLVKEQQEKPSCLYP
ncbi:(deoxy)nucleoside triphosphate pyrophosphohydrolase [Sporolactobacillus inulinus]|jgi:8-oxo-dGTP diphosphatase|uniref:8-oxo-dGTP diphosphatase n=2 Tax=Sporolactobacillus inulinus TaxID=2078 RepID=A0A4Y1ZBR9_9BACL|nr:(deoxy)nucleoside triphosphate pyrophosphohydrolase [Sporolactobacillus inulinus]KLI01725.1 DNA mismatch repair protein MutT [Sporolactobacillus inulinus CASD]GAY76542.1 mutator mutT protein [Sporolactobacillus inulinus]GEB78199.1 NUDIX hydrolase [Sporolactobacillus inulinus]